MLKNERLKIGYSNITLDVIERRKQNKAKDEPEEELPDPKPISYKILGSPPSWLLVDKTKKNKKN